MLKEVENKWEKKPDKWLYDFKTQKFVPDESKSVLENIASYFKKKLLKSKINDIFDRIKFHNPFDFDGF